MQIRLLIDATGMPEAACSAHFMLKLGYAEKDDVRMSLRVDSTNPPPRAFTMATGRGIRPVLEALNYWQLHALHGLDELRGTECSEQIQRAWTLQADWIFQRSGTKEASRHGARVVESGV